MGFLESLDSLAVRFDPVETSAFLRLTVSDCRIGVRVGTERTMRNDACDFNFQFLPKEQSFRQFSYEIKEAEE